jgi:hypothetical protein
MRRFPIAAALLAAVGSLAAPASASVVRALTPAELTADAALEVTAEVTAVSARWSADRRGLETVVTLATDDAARPTLTIVQPGGQLDGARQVIVGMPTYQVGERARFFLQPNADGATWRVYGWTQGKWPELRVGGVPMYLPGPHPDRAEFTTNGMVWPASAMPVRYLLGNAGSDDLGAGEIATAVGAAFAAWQEVPCSSLTFQLDGTTDLGVAVDGQNVILFIESGWIYGAEAAGATALWIVDGEQTADVAMNGEGYHWSIGPPGAGINSDTLDLQGVLTHELGHFSGLSHTMSAHDTMYYSWTPWPGQRTPSLDDKLGLCSIYPQVGDECTDAGQCAAGETCEVTAAGRLCASPADPIGAACSYDRIECEDFCLFTVADLSSGYCSRFCDTDADCPLTHHCDDASAGSMPVKVCFSGAQPQPDAGDACSGDEACPAGQYCTSMNACSFDCRLDDDCGGAATCDDRGRCQGATGDGGGCGCRHGGGDGRGASAIAVALAQLALTRRRRRC